MIFRAADRQRRRILRSKTIAALRYWKGLPVERRKKVDYEGKGKYKRSSITPIGGIVTYQQTLESYAATKCLLQRFKRIKIRGRKVTISDLIRFAIAWTAGVYDEYLHASKDTIGAVQTSETGKGPGFGVEAAGSAADPQETAAE